MCCKVCPISRFLLAPFWCRGAGEGWYLISLASGLSCLTLRLYYIFVSVCLLVVLLILVNFLLPAKSSRSLSLSFSLSQQSLSACIVSQSHTHSLTHSNPRIPSITCMHVHTHLGLSECIMRAWMTWVWDKGAGHHKMHVMAVSMCVCVCVCVTCLNQSLSRLIASGGSDWLSDLGRSCSIIFWAPGIIDGQTCLSFSLGRLISLTWGFIPGPQKYAYQGLCPSWTEYE